MIKAFLSHTSVDKDLVGLVHKKLTANNAWYDAANIENIWASVVQIRRLKCRHRPTMHIIIRTTARLFIRR